MSLENLKVPNRGQILEFNYIRIIAVGLSWRLLSPIKSLLFFQKIITKICKMSFCFKLNVKHLKTSSP